MIQAFAVFVMLAILSVLIIVHECGHFLVARLFGFQTPVFGFGLPFGPHWVVGHKWGTEFRVHACLLGGYVAIPELGDESNQDAFGLPMKPFRKFPIWQRALVAFAGVGFNILFAYIVTVVMLLSIGQPGQSTVVYALIKDNPIAFRAGITAGDEIISIDGYKITGPDDAVRYMTGHRNQRVNVYLRRHGIAQTISMTTNSEGRVGMALMSPYEKVEGNFFEVARSAFVKLCTLTYNMLDSLGKFFKSLLAGGKASAGQPAVSFQDLHGVLAIVKLGSELAQEDWSQLFLFTILISMDLAIINLVPWPALDGGHLAFMALEAVRGRPMSERRQGEIVKWGFISLILLMVVIMVNDVTALFSGKLDFKRSKGKMTETRKTEVDKGPISPGKSPEQKIISAPQPTKALP